jgi:hypothetical protein
MGFYKHVQFVATDITALWAYILHIIHSIARNPAMQAYKFFYIIPQHNLKSSLAGLVLFMFYYPMA